MMNRPFTLLEVYVLATIAQHKRDKQSQDRLLQRLSGDALLVGKAIKDSSTVATEHAQIAEGFRKWARKLSHVQNSVLRTAHG